jgi:hypothetical protein
MQEPGHLGQPDAELTVDDPRYGAVSVKAWAGLHPQLSRRGRFAEVEELPIVKATIIRVEVERLPGRRRKPKGPLWLWQAGPGLPDLDLCWRAYLHRFDIEHTYRFAKQTLGWDNPALRHPEQFDRRGLAGGSRDQPTAPRPGHRRRQPPPLGTPPQARKAHSRPGPPGFHPPTAPARHPRQPAKTQQARPRPTQRTPQRPRTPPRRPQKGRLTTKHPRHNLSAQVKTQVR